MIMSIHYTDLRVEAVGHGINETEVSIVTSSHAQLPNFKNILSNCPKVTHVIFIEEPLRMGEENPAPPNPPELKDIGIIMYTSGSTGDFP